MKISIKSIIILVIINALCSELKAQIYADKDTSAIPLKIEKFRKLILKNPDDINANYWFIHYYGLNSPGLEKQYKDWMLRFPKSAVIPLSIGNAYQNERNQKALNYLEQAVKINPKLPGVWRSLYELAYFKNDDSAMNNYLTQGKQANPDDGYFAFFYATTFKEKQFEKYLTLLDSVYQKHSTNEYGIRALYTLTLNTKNDSLKLKHFERIKNQYSPEKFRISSDAMASYFMFLLELDFDKAMALVENMTHLKIKYAAWDKLLYELKKINVIRSLIAEDKPKQALDTLQKIKFPNFVGQPKKLMVALKVQTMEKALGTAIAYDSLMFYFKSNPSVFIYKNIISYGNKLNKDSAQIRVEILQFLRKNANRAYPFKLKNYLTTDSVSLHSLKGNVVLLTYWFPHCGPCNAELPYFENVLKDFSPSEIKYVGINIEPREDDLVLPMMKSKGYTFIPLRETKYREKGNLDNIGIAPVNFLIDRDGLLIFKDFRIDGSNEEDLKLMIGLLLNKNVM